MNSKSEQPPLPEERRGFFRITDMVNLSYRQVPTEELGDRLERLEQEVSSNFTVISSLSAISQQMTAHLHRIETDYPDVAAYLKALDQKLDILGRAFLVQEENLAEQSAQVVNVSASGMAVASAEPLAEGVTLEIKLLLLPSLTGIITYGEVVACEKQTDSDTGHPYRLRVNFSHMRESDRDVLIRHLLRRQGELLRKNRENKTGDN